MVAINSILFAAACTTAVVASPIAQVQQRDLVSSEGGLPELPAEIQNLLPNVKRGDSDKTFLALTTLLAQVGDFVGDTLNDVLHLDLSSVDDDVQKLLKNVLSSVKQLTGAATAFKPGNGFAADIQNQMASNSLQNVLTGVAKLVNDLLSKLLDSDLIQTVAADLRDLVKNLDDLVTGLADNLIGYSSITSLLGGILSAVNSALEVAPVSTKA